MSFRAQLSLPTRRIPETGRAALFALVAALCLFAAAPGRAAQPFIWDDDQDGLDDRMETVSVLGYRYSFEDADTTLRQRIDVSLVSGVSMFGVYVVFKSTPTNADFALLAVRGMPVLHRFEGIAAVRSIATFAQAQTAAELPNVERIESISLNYALAREDAASVGASDASEQVFPSWTGSGGGGGSGVVVAILDTGINDAPEGGWPGHESLLGKALGGATFLSPDSALNTPRDGSENPSDHGGSATSAHGTHVAGTILGSGGESGFAAGVASGARFVDVKVLGDLGIGTGVAEALDWCIHNRARDWGAGPAWTGIDVINLSLSSLDPADGNDVASRLAARAAELGIAVVASVGNEGEQHFVPSPGSGDGVLAIGAYDAQRTGRASDDAFAPFSDAGPRASDGDLEFSDEQKPDLLAPGVAILSANGDLSTDGAQYVRRSGTSMSAAIVSGAVAALRSEFPSLTPGEIASLLRTTARRELPGAPPGEGGVDPNWNSVTGFGALDLYAARLELTSANRSQVRRLVVDAGESSLEAELWTQRERGAAHFVLEVAPDQGGAPGPFTPADSVAAGGDSLLTNSNLQAYPLSLAIAPADRGLPFWYRVAFTENGVRWSEPARRIVHPVGPSLARIEVRIVHNAYDHDVSASVEVEGGFGPGASGSPAISIPLPGTNSAVSSDWVSGTSTLGNIAWDYELVVPAGAAGAFLPPSSANPWVLEVGEGGYLNRSGRIERFRIVWHATGGDVIYEGGPAPVQTVEGGTVQSWVPAPSLDVEPTVFERGFRATPSPVRSGGDVTFAAPGFAGGDVHIFDLGGREVGRVALAPGLNQARWNARSRAGDPLSAGVYFARAGRFSARLVVLSP